MVGGGGDMRRTAIRATHAEAEERGRGARRPARGDDPPNTVSVWATARRRSPIGSHGQREWPTRGLDAGVDARHAKNRGAEGEAVTVIYL